MNKIFRVLWSAAQQCYVVASELATGKSKAKTSVNKLAKARVPQAVLSGLAVAIMLALPASQAFAATTVIANNKAVIVDGQDIVATGASGESSRGLSATKNGSIEFSNGTISTKVANGLGAFADAGSTVTIKQSDISTNGGSAYAIYAKSGGAVTAEGVNIITKSSTGYGAFAESGATVSLKKVDISTNGGRAYGIYAKSGGVVTADGVNITTKAGTAYGVQTADGFASLINSTITTSGETAHALYAMNGGSISVDNSDVIATGHISAGAYATGGGSTITISNSNLTTTHTSSEAAYAKAGGTVILTNTDINTSKINSYGLRANENNSTVNFNGGTITTTGDASAIYASDGGMVNVNNAVINNAMRYALQATGPSTVNLSNTTINSQGGGITSYAGAATNLENVVINASGEGSDKGQRVGIFTYSAGSSVTAKNMQLNIFGSDMNGFQVAYGGKATLDNVAINIIEGKGGLQVEVGSTLSGTNVRIINNSQDPAEQHSGLRMGSGDGDNNVDLSHSEIIVNSTDGAGLLFHSTSDNSNNMLTLTDSQVTASQGTAIEIAGTENTDVVTSGSYLTGKTFLSAGIDNDGTTSNFEVTGENGSVFNGDVVINRANTAKNIINLNNNSVWNGATDSLENLNIANGSAWNVTKSSTVDNLTLDNGTLNMTAPGTDYSEVTVGNLTSNNGTIDFKTHLMADDSATDHLLVTGDYAGNSNVVVQNAGGTGENTINGIELIRVDGSVDGTFTQQGRIVAGAYDYHLVQDGNKWLLESNIENVNPTHPGEGSGGGAGVISPVKGALVTRPEDGSYTANLAAANTLFNTSLDDRLGETHYIGADGKKHSTSLWLRNAGGHTRFSDSSGQLKTTGNRYVMQLGGDVAQWSSNGDDRFHLGVMGGYANAQSNTHSSVTGYSAKGEVHGYSTGVYATWLQDNAEKTGAYVDSWMLYNWFDNSVKGQDIAPESYKSKGITASVEAGYSVKVAELSERSSFYLQPKAQVTWMGVEADDHRESNGTRVVGEGNNNVQTRLGVRAYAKGHNPIDDGKNRTFEPFIEANWIHNTEAFGSSLNGVAVKQAGARDIGEVKVGVDAKLNNTVNLWGNIGQQMGNQGYSDTSAMVGLKVNF